MPTVFVVSASKSLISGSITALLAEPDKEFAHSAMEADLKLLEGLLELSPEDKELLTLAAQGYTGYALIYLEECEPERAIEFYTRARNFGLRALSLRDERFADPDISYKLFDSAVHNLHKADVGAAYWTGMAWGSLVSLQLTSPTALPGFPKAKGLMEWVARTDSSFYHYGAFWFLGTYYSSLPPMMGGSAEKALVYFEKADKYCQGQFQLGRVLFAKGYAIQALDKERFEILLNSVIDYAKSPPDDEIKELRLLNRSSARRAEKLLKQADEIF